MQRPALPGPCGGVRAWLSWKSIKEYHKKFMAGAVERVSPHILTVEIHCGCQRRQLRLLYCTDRLRWGSLGTSKDLIGKGWALIPPDHQMQGSAFNKTRMMVFTRMSRQYRVASMNVGIYFASASDVVDPRSPRLPVTISFTCFRPSYMYPQIIST